MYERILRLSDNNEVYLVKDTGSGKEYVSRILDDYVYDVYVRLKQENVCNIPRIYEVNKLDGRKIEVVSEYIEGISLLDYVERKGRLDEAEIVDIGIRVCDILTRIHSLNPPLIHRDIKASNVLLREDGEVFLVDFGAAREVKFDDTYKESDTIRMGTKEYAAPEQYGFGTSDKQTDYYAFGILLNFMAKGKISKTPIENNPLTPIIYKCIRMEKKQRYVSSELIKEELEGCIENYRVYKGETIDSKEESRVYIDDYNDINLERGNVKYCESEGIYESVLGGVTVEEYFCTNCGAILDEQIGFSPDNKTWVCTECGALMTNGEASPNSEKYPDVHWYCDNCNSYLNIQKGFVDTKGFWKCTKCGYENVIGEGEIG